MVNKPFVVKTPQSPTPASEPFKRIGPETSEEDERLIISTADNFSAFRFLGSGTYERLGDFDSLESCLQSIKQHCEQHPRDRGFMVYASKTEGSRHAHVCNTNSEGDRMESYQEWKERRENRRKEQLCKKKQ